MCLKYFSFEALNIHMNNCQKSNNEKINLISFEVKYESTEENKFKKVKNHVFMNLKLFLIKGIRY